MQTHSHDKSAGPADERGAAARRRLRLKARGPLGEFIVVGQTAKALLALIRAGGTGITALEAETWAFRLAAYVHVLRHQFGLNIHMEHETHDGGWHGRYVLRSPVSIGEARR